MYKQQRTNRLTGIVPGEETLTSFCGMPWKQANILWIDDAGDRPIDLRARRQRKKWLFAISFNHAEPLVVEILPGKTTMTAATGTQERCWQMLLRCPGAATKRENHKNMVYTLLGDSGRVVNSLGFCPASLKSLGCFYFRCGLSSQWKAVIVNLWILHCQL